MISLSLYIYTHRRTHTDTYTQIQKERLRNVNIQSLNLAKKFIRDLENSRAREGKYKMNNLLDQKVRNAQRMMCVS